MRAAFCSAGVLLQKKKEERKKLPAKIRNGFGKVGYTHLTSRTCSCWKGPWAAIKLCPAVCLHAKLFECMFVCVWSYLWFTPHHACPVLACDYPCCWLRFGLCWVSGRLQASFPLPRVPPPPPPDAVSWCSSCSRCVFWLSPSDFGLPHNFPIQQFCGVRPQKRCFQKQIVLCEPPSLVN